MTNIEKRCTKCGNVKPATEFHNQSYAPNGLSAWCKECYRANSRKGHERKKDQVKMQPIPIPEEQTCLRCGQVKQASDFSKNLLRGLTAWCKECKSKRQKELRSNRRDHLRRYYGLTLEQYSKMEQDQGGLCAICRQEPPPSKQGLVVDHNHQTGKVRGLLCNRCNTTLRYVEAAPDAWKDKLFTVEAKRYLGIV